MEAHHRMAKCRYALGMEDRTIPDSDITASSAWSDSTEAKHGRCRDSIILQEMLIMLSTGEGDGAWCPAGSVFPSGSEYLQVDLHTLHFLSLVGTQGRHADGHGREFARSYRLRYSRDGRQWITWKDRWGQEVISGNENTYDVVLKDLGPPIIARMVRFYPLADRVMSVCLRVELYGCLWNDGLKAYTAPMGHVMNLSSSPVYLNDSIYDGSIEAGMLFGGLGQLCDGVLGGDDFAESKELRVWPGYDYVGWSREALGQPTVDIEFHFEKTRIFHSMQEICNVGNATDSPSSVGTGRCPTGRCPTGRCPTGRCPTGRCPTGRCPTGHFWLDTFGGVLLLNMLSLQVHSNNRHTQGVRVFSEVLCEFKASLLSRWTEPPLKLPVPLEDLKDPSSRPVALPLGGQPAQILRCRFSFADRWLLISEISFYSEPFEGALPFPSMEAPSPSSTPRSRFFTSSPPASSFSPSANSSTGRSTGKSRLELFLEFKSCPTTWEVVSHHLGSSVPPPGKSCPTTWEVVSNHVGSRVQPRGKSCPTTWSKSCGNVSRGQVVSKSTMSCPIMWEVVSNHVGGRVQSCGRSYPIMWEDVSNHVGSRVQSCGMSCPTTWEVVSNHVGSRVQPCGKSCPIMWAVVSHHLGSRVPPPGKSCPTTWEVVSNHVGSRVQPRGRSCPIMWHVVSNHVASRVQSCGKSCPIMWEVVSNHVGGRIQPRGKSCPTMWEVVSNHVANCVPPPGKSCPTMWEVVSNHEGPWGFRFMWEVLSNQWRSFPPPGKESEEFAAGTPRAGLPVAKDDSSNTAILIGCLVGIILLLLAVIVVILWRQYWKKLLSKAQGSLSSDELRVHLSVPSDNVVINNTNTHTYSSRYQRIHTFPDERERDAEYQEPSTVLRPREQRDSTALLLNNPAYHLLLSDLRHGPNRLPNCSREPEKPQNLPQACGIDVDDKALPVQEGPPPYPGAPPPILPGAHYAEASGGGPSVPHYAEADIISLQGVSGNNTYAVPALSTSPADCPPLPELPRERLIFKEKLGEGQFGEVHLCEIENPQDLANLEFPFNVRKGRPLLVAVKILRPDASKNARNDFLKEVKILSRLKDPNIIRLLGVCVSSDPLCMVTEYMESGDLNQYLSQRALLDKTGPLHNTPTISYPALISMASQIASGMKFLSSLNFVHRDLATRNCLVGGERGDVEDRMGERHIKIADFGMSRNLYAGDYYRIQGRAVLPIRWMAWECILMGKFTTASDVWAFGVTLWEMLSVCQEQPYSHMTDEQVIDNAGEFFRDHGRQVYLARPAVCPQGLYELMLSCWNRDCKLRPSFTHIHSFLTEDAMNMV
ncbi:hypothetical protein NFI96_024835 [Prochilodus magdalenae]|nr:hypothetical protein NFI96_024835 [Prochilodus magdalenae]